MLLLDYPPASPIITSTKAEQTMIIRSKKRLPLVATDRQTVYPVLPLMTGVLFPGMTFTIQVGRADNLALIEKCSDGKTQLVAMLNKVV